MKTPFIRVLGLLWLCTGLLLTAYAATIPDLSTAGVIAVIAAAGYTCTRRGRLAYWMMFSLALLFATGGIGYFFKWGFGWDHGSADWLAWAFTLFSLMALGALIAMKLRKKAKPSVRP